MKRYIGRRLADNTLAVNVEYDDGKGHPLQHHVRHSPTGFECGYGGSGPADLARCILIDHRLLHKQAEREGDSLVLPYQAFKFEVIAHLPRDADWTLTDGDIDAWEVTYDAEQELKRREREGING